MLSMQLEAPLAEQAPLLHAQHISYRSQCRHKAKHWAAGHNGAGKTTAISVLTGMIPASGGSAYVGGHSIASEMAQIRKSLGVCPQFDILWPSITVREHLEIFAAIKGFGAGDRGRLAEDAAADVGEQGPDNNSYL